MRRHFGTWGLELSDDEFAQAFAALGVIQGAWRGWPLPPDPLQTLLLDLSRKAWQQRVGDVPQPLRWELYFTPEEAQRFENVPPPAALVKGWQALLAEARQKGSFLARPRLSVSAVMLDAPSLRAAFSLFPEPLDWLSRPSVECAGVFTQARGAAPERELDRWPLRAGILPGPDSSPLSAALAERASRPGSNFTVEVLTPERARCGLLVLPQGLREAVGTLLTTTIRPDADIVLILGPVEETDSRAEALIRTLLELCGCRAVILARVSTRTSTAEATADYVHELVFALSHDLPLDAAAFAASKVLDHPPPYLHGDPGFLDTARLSSRLERLGRRIKRSAAHEDGIPGLEAFRPPPDSFLELDAQLGSFSPEWTHETGAAQDLAGLAMRTRDVSEKAAREAPPRFLRAQVMEPDGDRPVEALQRARGYRTEVSIGPRTSGYLAINQPFPTPKEEPPDAEGHRLQVTFFDPRLMDEPQLDELRLPPTGESSACGFFFYTREGVDALEARITVLHRNRVLQTGVLRGKVDGQSALTFVLDAVPRTRLQVLSERSYFDGALVINDTDAGEHVVTAMADTLVARIKLTDVTVNDLTTVLNSQLSAIASTPEDYRALRDPGNERLLRNLARRGAVFHQTLAEHSIIGPRFHGQGPVQVVSARPDAFLPIELAYRFPIPEKTAPLCAHAERGLETGTCPEPCKEGGTEGRVCPLGFWSMSRVIERHEHTPRNVKMEDDHELRCEPLGPRTALARPAAAVMAGSPIANNAEPQTLENLRDALAEVFQGKVYEAHSWLEWVEHIAQPDRPMLLVLVPHHVQGAHAVELLQLADKDTLESFDVDAGYVVGKPPVVPPHPVVFLLGCETQLARIAFESFVAMFRKHGAAIVVSTIATVLGRDVGPVAAELARELRAHHPGERSFGEVLLRARRRLLSQGRVMVLALTAYGDADWKLMET